MKPSLPIVRPRLPRLSQIARDFDRCLEQGQVTNNGPWVQEFEARLTEYLGVPTLAFSSGQAALMTMLATVVETGGEVICPSFTFCATPAAVVWAGLGPVFVEVDPSTLTMDVNAVRNALTPHTAAILAVDPYGICSDYTGLEEISSANDIPLFIDSAPAFGSLCDGRPTGARGSAQIFSFHATKPFSTMEGGCLCSRNEIVLHIARTIRNFGQDMGEAWCPGINGKMMEVCALLGIEALRDWDATVLKRKVQAPKLYAGLAGIPGVGLPQVPPGQSPIWTYMPIFVDANRRDDIAVALAVNGIETRRYYDACHSMPAFKKYAPEPLPITETLAAGVLALPVYNDMEDAEVDRIVKSVREAVGS
jgi:dTDP-4-amino-4,6-dideoxygalactose transaminase